MYISALIPPQNPRLTQISYLFSPFFLQKTSEFGYLPIEYESIEWWSAKWVRCLTVDYPYEQSRHCLFETNYPTYIKKPERNTQTEVILKLWLSKSS